MWGWFPIADCDLRAMWQQCRGIKRRLAYPALGVSASSTVQCWCSSASCRSASHLSCLSPGESICVVLWIWHQKGSLCMIDNWTRVWLHAGTRVLFTLTGEPILLVSFFLTNCSLNKLWCLFTHVGSLSMQCKKSIRTLFSYLKASRDSLDISTGPEARFWQVSLTFSES